MRRVLTLSVIAAAIAFLSIGAGGTVAAAGPAAAIPGDAPTSATAAECGVGDGTDLVGCWNGTHYEDDLGFNQTDGLTESELEELTHLTMARVEHVRERPFREDVPVETVTRTEFMNDSEGGGAGGSDAAFQRWNDQVWKALFVVGEDENASDAIDSVYGGAVTGFYSPAEDRIVLVVSEGEDPQIDPSTLAHELAHAMQDQYHDLTRPRYVGATQDADLATDGIVEGEAVHIEELYDARCAANWTCLAAPDSGGGGGGTTPDYNFGILQTVLQPYSDGALYAEELVDEEGWSAVNETMNEPPNATSEVIHREPDYETSEVDFEDAATGGWETYPDQGVNGSDTAGEASMFVMFWYQSYEYRHAVLDPDATVRENVRIHTRPDEQLRTRPNYNYASESTDGWAGDELYPYRNGGNGSEMNAPGDDANATDGEDGYVWVTEWQTAADARDFHETYLRMLTAHGDDEYTDGEVYDIADGDFRGAYGVERNGTTVTIAHGPEPADVLELRPDSGLARPSADDGDDADGSDGEDGEVGDGTDDGDGTDGGSGTDGDGSAGPDADTGDGVPGFGVPVALAGLLAAVAFFARRVRR
ncbi:Hvo_1808 family surface protein [Halorubrum salsamenti]|uniref:Hvo_1808 family surface protein n=1 Tax=Halorubrum salsamenti TaxID=2583990 RepID=UPI0011A0D2FB|nr:Hvo_1808 family surface protein [Halorubrum salsamenti]